MIYISGIEYKDIDKVWDCCVPFLELGNDKSQNEMTVDDIYNMCCSQEMQLWIIHDEDRNIYGAGITQIILYPNKSVCRIITLGGKDFDDWTDTINTIEEWARNQDCESLEMWCRKGFQRKLTDYGYKQIYTVLGKDISTIH